MLKELETLGGETAVRQAADADPFQSVDPEVLLEKGVVAWSYDRSVDTETLGSLVWSQLAAA